MRGAAACGKPSSVYPVFAPAPRRGPPNPAKESPTNSQTLAPARGRGQGEGRPSRRPMPYVAPRPGLNTASVSRPRFAANAIASTMDTTPTPTAPP